MALSAMRHTMSPIWPPNQNFSPAHIWLRFALRLPSAFVLNLHPPPCAFPICAFLAYFQLCKYAFNCLLHTWRRLGLSVPTCNWALLFETLAKLNMSYSFSMLMLKFANALFKAINTFSLSCIVFFKRTEAPFQQHLCEFFILIHTQ